ncbi:response regulator [Roseospira navarrensis]|nr:response regulator [Roseospira navarrensis]
MPHTPATRRFRTPAAPAGDARSGPTERTGPPDGGRDRAGFGAADPDAVSIISVDAAGRILAFDAAAEATFGYRREEALGQPMGELILPPHLRADHEAAMARLHRTGLSRVVGRRIELEAMRSDGARFPCEVTISSAHPPEGPIYTAHIRDLSNRVAAEQALRAAASRPAETGQDTASLLAQMGHEIRAPLNGVLGILGLLEDSPLGPMESHWVRTGMDSATALLDAINDVLDHAWIEAGRMTLEPEPVGLGGLVEGVLDVMRPRADVRGLALSAHVDADVPRRVTADGGRIRQVLFNLLSNAIRVTDRGTVSVRVRLLPADGSTGAPPVPQDGARWVRFTVADTGPGIPAERHADLFQPAGARQAGLAGRPGVTGMGLLLCRRLVDLMGGRIGVESRPEEGARFHVDLPLAPSVALGLEPIETAGSGASDGVLCGASTDRRGKSIRILLAEDNQSTAMVAKTMLSRAGYRVDTVANGAEAVQAIGTLPYDLILMDLSMPVMDGLEATRRIRALAGRRNRIPVIAMTAHSLADARTQVLEAGMNDFLPKPSSRHQMIAMIRHWTRVRCWDRLHAEAAGPTALRQPAPQTVMPPVDEATPRLDVRVLHGLAQDTDAAVLRGLCEGFAEEALNRVNAISEAVARDDGAALEHHAHALSSSAGTFGAMRLYRITHAIETACRQNEVGKGMTLARTLPLEAERALAALPEAVESVQRAMRSHADPRPDPDPDRAA